MNISYYMPFKPPGHNNPSGDLIIGTELQKFLAEKHTIELASTLRSRWIYWKPWNLYLAKREQKRICNFLQTKPQDLWFTYHSYYKAPDIIGPACCRKLKIPYTIFQGIYSTKRKRKLKTFPGFILNRRALEAAKIVFTNKKADLINLKRLLSNERIYYIAPGVQPDQFCFDPDARKVLREQWQTGDRRVVLTTAMLRPGVKTEGVKTVINSCAALREKHKDILLVVIGDGKNRDVLELEAREKLGKHCLFLGKIPRLNLYHYYSAADLFAFPGIQESLGMVYLEAQSAGLPVAAYSDWGASEAVVNNSTGLLTPASHPEYFTNSIETLLNNQEIRNEMRVNATNHIRTHHDSSINYRHLTNVLEDIVQQHR